jgi:hypothetical protein
VGKERDLPMVGQVGLDEHDLDFGLAWHRLL